MMYGYTSVIGGCGILGNLIWTIIFIDLLLVGIILWRKILSKEPENINDKMEIRGS